MTDIESSKYIEDIKKELSDELIPYIGKLFPDNKIPLYLSPLSQNDNNYLAWAAYSSIGPNSKYEDNYCRTYDDSNKLYYPTDRDDLQDCKPFFTNKIMDLLDLNQHILSSINSIEFDNKVENEIRSDEVKAELKTKLNEYSEIKKELNNQQRTENSLKNISQIINNLNNDLNNNDANTKNQVNINYETVDQEKYKYLNTNYYIYTIIALTVIIFIVHFIVLYY